MKEEIIRKALVLLGSNSNIQGNISGGNAANKAENLCEEFVEAAIEENVLSVKWGFALKRIDNIEGEESSFKPIPGINDCVKVAVIVPSNLEFYIESGRVYFKGGKLTSIFYYSQQSIELLLDNDKTAWRQIPQSFKLLCSLGLASQVAFAMYSDSLFADGLKRQYLIRLEEARRIHSIGYNLINSGEI
nr:hypothetical protein [Rickettsia endosymbiont of Ceutorhynchus assimilis]